MTQCCDDDTIPAPCTCEACCGGDLPVNPFVAFRVAYGMLLDEDAFKTMMGNPRGKQMFHSAWLHRSGVVWGLRVCREGELVIKVSPGAAVDQVGRELLVESTMCLDLRDWLTKQKLDGPQDGCKTTEIQACLVAEFQCCPTDPVPTLADPCDMTRKHDDYSRVVESVKLDLRPGCCPQPEEIYHRVRVLLGLDDVGDDEADEEAVSAVMTVVSASPDQRPQVLLQQFRLMAALDVMDLRPPVREGEPCLSLFPALDECAGVVLAAVEIHVKEESGCTEIVDVCIDPLVRRSLLPTATIQELSCAVAPAIFGAAPDSDAGGPRVIRDSLRVSDDGLTITFKVTQRLIRGSIKRGVAITSLSSRGWVDEEIDTVGYEHLEHEHPEVTITLVDRPINEIVRLIVRGTGETPVFGSDPAVPLAGFVGGPPGGTDDGVDAVMTFPNPVERTEDTS
jgi:hypothetical protein